MVRVVAAARTNRVSPALPVIVSDGLNGYSLSGDGAATLPPDFVGGPLSYSKNVRFGWYE